MNKWEVLWRGIEVFVSMILFTWALSCLSAASTFENILGLCVLFGGVLYWLPAPETRVRMYNLFLDDTKDK